MIRRADPERGAAVVELLVVFLTLLVPLVYVMVVTADVQRALLGQLQRGARGRSGVRPGRTGGMRSGGRRWRTARCWPPTGCAPGTRVRGCGCGSPAQPAVGPAGSGAGSAVGSPSAAGPGCAGGFGPGAEVEVVVTYRVAVARVPFLGPLPGRGDGRGHAPTPRSTGTAG